MRLENLLNNDCYRDRIINILTLFRAINYSETERDNLKEPKAGQIIFNSTTNKLNFYNGSTWEVITSI
jgi:hypothetical protein